jgi:hypothetical protein
MQPALALRRKLGAGEIVTGVLATQHFWPGLVEVVKQGYHFLCLGEPIASLQSKLTDLDQAARDVRG